MDRSKKASRLPTIHEDEKDIKTLTVFNECTYISIGKINEYNSVYKYFTYDDCNECSCCMSFSYKIYEDKSGIYWVYYENKEGPNRQILSEYSPTYITPTVDGFSCYCCCWPKFCKHQKTFGITMGKQEKKYKNRDIPLLPQ